MDDTRISMAANGTYNIAFSLQFYNPTNQRIVFTIWLKENGTSVPNSATDIHVGSSLSDERAVAAWNFFVQVTNKDTDYFEIAWASSSAGTPESRPQLFYGAPVNAVAPTIPSVILTVNQVG